MPQGGLFRQRDPEKLRLGCVRAAPLPGARLQNYYLIDQSYPDRQLRCAPLFSRGWVFQERMLAVRVIYFAEEQVFWECGEECKCEAFPAGIPFAPNSKDKLPQILARDATATLEHFECPSCAIFREWNILVQRYSECQFTHAGDKLSAFMGIASYFPVSAQNNYAFGMWKPRIVDQLGYVVEKPAMKRSSAYRAPSWSWASLDGPIMAPHLNEEPYTHISVQVDYMHLGQLHLRGVLTRATYSHATSSRKADIFLESRKVLNVIILRDHLGIEMKKGKPFTLLALQSGLEPCPYLGCLVLEPILCALPRTTYRRIGFTHVFQREELNAAIVEPEMYAALGIIMAKGSSTVEQSRLSDIVII
ncbi:hypothetical protein EDB81DRAFT_884737 [Dactylonectria macrodidyma]|uniref:Heterokaryon incompatibility domain-containing protein n=1 Tax=Dactylonectria macrodidyma TaxID=307937 RepID=A0A9P9EQN0_9HYPO|nr:hypothetical protein EDB81DRAFT_884737 [Dactylonectria macrodidyma]